MANRKIPTRFLTQILTPASPTDQSSATMRPNRNNSPRLHLGNRSATASDPGYRLTQRETSAARIEPAAASRAPRHRIPNPIPSERTRPVVGEAERSPRTAPARATSTGRGSSASRDPSRAARFSSPPLFSSVRREKGGERERRVEIFGGPYETEGSWCGGAVWGGMPLRRGARDCVRVR